MAAKTKGISTKIEPEMFEELEEFERTSGVDKSTLTRAALRAALDCWKERGALVFPLQMVDSSKKNEK